MLEAVIALPVFALVLAGTFHLHERIAASQDAMLAARAAAWDAALDGCRESKTGGDELRDGSALPHLDQLHQATAPRAGSDPNSMFGSLDDIPVVGSVLGSIVPRGIRAQRSVDVAASARLGFAATSARSAAYVACNEAPADPWKTTLKIFTSMLPNL